MKKYGAITAGIILAAMLFSVQVCFGLSVSSYVTNTDGITFTCNTGLMKVQICQSDIVHLTYTPTSSFPSKTQLVVTRTWSTPSFTTSDAGDTVTLQTARIKVKVSKSTANLTYTDLSNNVVLSEAAKSMAATTVEGISTYTVTTSYNSPSTEALYGLGQHMEGAGTNVVVNYKGAGQTNMDEMYGNPTYYTAVAVLVSTRGYGLYWDNYSHSWFYGNDNSNTQFRYVSECGSIIDYYFFYGPQMDSIISKYRVTTGKVPLFPKWAYGLIQSKDRYQSQSEYLGVQSNYRSNNIPLDVVVQDWHYWDGAGVQGCYLFNSNWTNVKDMITQMHNANVHTMISIWSQLESGCANYTTFNNNGWLWPNTDGSCTTHFIDAYSSAAVSATWTNLYNAFFNPSVQGWDAWWLDNDEPFAYPCGMNRHSLTTAMGKGCLYYNTYTVPWTAAGYKNWRRDVSGKRFVMLHRALYAGQQAHSTIQWNNDIHCNFGTLANCVPCGLNVTMSGIPYWTTDIGGYWGYQDGIDWSTAANRELMTRWLQYGSFCPVFRIHGNGNSKELYQSCWDATTKANLLLTDKLHYRLMPYIYSLAWMTTNNDYTQMRHLIMDFTSDANVKGIGTQYMYGPAIMVSPVTTQGALSRSIYMPAGTWYDFWTGASTTYTSGTTITASAPLNHIPLHVKAGSIVPMGPEIQYATQRADTIELRVYKGANGSFTLYEDEGDNYNYESGSYATIPMSYDDGTGKIIIGARSGSFTGMLTNRVFAVVFVSSGHGSDEPKTASPDCIVNYTGSAVSACPAQPVGTCDQCSIRKTMNPGPVTLKTAQSRIVLSAEYSGRAKEIALYDISGHLLKKIITRRQIVDTRKDFGLPAGVYIVKVRVVR
jgi:alpha-D-xyloside xylohydrolase